MARNWSNFWQHPQAVDVLFDTRAIWHCQRSEQQTLDLCSEWFARLVAPESEHWEIGSQEALLAEVPKGALWSRPLTQIFSFLGTSFSLAPHAVAQCFEDNHLSLVRTCFRVSEQGGEVKFLVAR